MSSTIAGNILEFKPWKTEIARFLWDGYEVTLHSTGQVFLTYPDGRIYAYLELPCHFGCMKEVL